MNTLNLKQNFDAVNFLRQYWQKEPVLLSGLIPNFRDVITAEELAGLACEEFIESRLVTEFTTGDWQLRNGPFAESDITTLPDTHWTLLVQAVDQWIDEVADIKKLFNFVPDWRIEDIMISYATAGGGVGPHFDYYDVFLLQGLGQRRWQVGSRCAADSSLRPGTDLRILRDFESIQEFQLNAGDALYVPPRYAHWGVAETESLCYSIGCRAPSFAEMIEGFSDFLIKDNDPAFRYEDTNLSPASRHGEIRPELVTPSFQLLLEQFSKKQKFISWFGCHVSQPKYPELINRPETAIAADEFADLLNSVTYLQRNSCSRFAFIESSEESVVLCFVDGAMMRFESPLLEYIARICGEQELDGDTLVDLAREPEIAELLRQLVNQGSLLLPE